MAEAPYPPLSKSNAPPSAASVISAHGLVQGTEELSMEGAAPEIGPASKDKLLRMVGHVIWEKVKAAQEDRLRKYETTSFALWPEILSPYLPPANERTYKITDVATLVYRDTAAMLQRNKIAVYTALIFDALTAQPFLETKERMSELAQRLADRFLPPGRLIPSQAEVSRVEGWIKKYVEALASPNQMQKLRNTVRLHAIRSQAGRSLLARNPLPEMEGAGLGVVGPGGVVEMTPGDALGGEELLGMQKRKRGNSNRGSKRAKQPVEPQLPSSPQSLSVSGNPDGSQSSRK